MSAPKRSTWIVTAIVALAFALRLVGVFDEALPFSFYPDEINNVERSVNFYNPATGFELNPHWFHKPTLGYYLNFFCFGVYYLFGHFITGQFDSANDFATAFLNQERTGFYVIGRLIQVFFGSLTVWVTYRAGRLLQGRQLGYIAAFFLAIAPAHIEFSCLVKNDVASCFLASLAFLGCLHVLRLGRGKDYLFAGFMIGAGWATKYVPLTLAPSLLAAHLLRPVDELLGPKKHRLLAVAGLAFLLAAFAGSPYNFLDPAGYHASIKKIIDGVGGVFFGAGEVDSMKYGLLELARYAFAKIAGAEVVTLPLSILALLGWMFVLKEVGKKKALLLLGWVFVTYVVLVAFNAQRVRPNHIIAVMPALALLSGLGLMAIGTTLARLTGKKQGLIMGLFLLALVIPLDGTPADAIATQFRRVQREPPQSLALRWMEENLDEGATILNVAEVLPLISSGPRQEWLQTRISFELALSERYLADNRERLGRASANEAKALRLGTAHHEHRLIWWKTQAKKLSLSMAAAPSSKFKRFDNLIMLSPWQTEKSEKVSSAAFGFNDLWDRFPLPSVGRLREQVPGLQDLPPVERYRGAADLDRSQLSRPLRVRLGVLPNRPVDFVVCSESSYGNFVRPEEGSRPPEVSRRKRASFKTWAAFYDDLKAHYNYWEFPGDRSLDLWSVRIYDLRQRLPANTATRLY